MLSHLRIHICMIFRVHNFIELEIAHDKASAQLNNVFLLRLLWSRIVKSIVNHQYDNNRTAY